MTKINKGVPRLGSTWLGTTALLFNYVPVRCDTKDTKKGVSETKVKKLNSDYTLTPFHQETFGTTTQGE